jgi:phosphoglycolate phosphatase
MNPPLQGILFDLDGTLLDTAPDMVAALNVLREEHRRPSLPFDSVRPSVSHGSTRLVTLGFPEADPSEFARLQQRFLEIYRRDLSVRTRLFPGMEQVLAVLAERRLPAGIVTNKPAWLTDPLLEELGLRAHFACVVSGDTVSQRKPHAMPLLHAAELAKVAAGACVYVGDAERDVQAAHAAGMCALVATYGYLGAHEDWRAWAAEGSIDRPLELIEWLDSSGR